MISATDTTYASLSHLFLDTLSPVNETRKQAEESLHTVSTYPDFIPSIIHLLSQPTLNATTAQSAAIYFFNYIKKHWRPKSDAQAEFNMETKLFITDALFSILFAANDAAVKTVANTLKFVALNFEPETHVRMLDTLDTALQNNTPEHLARALHATSKVAKALFSNFDKAVPLEKKLHLMRIVVDIGNALPDAQWLDHLCSVAKSLVSYTACISTHEATQTHDILPREIFTLLEKLTTLPEPAHQQTLGADERENTAYWTLKDHLTRINTRLAYALRHKHIKNAKLKQTCKDYVAWTAKVFIATHTRPNTYIAQKVLAAACKFFDYTVCIKDIFDAVLLPNIQFVLHFLVLDVFCMKDADVEMWNEEPDDFVRAEEDRIDVHLVRSRATSLLFFLGKKRRVVLPYVLDAFEHAAGAFAAQPSLARAVQKEAASRAIGILAPFFIKNLDKDKLRQVLMARVFPDLHCPFPVLQRRALWVFGQYCDFALSTDDYAALTLKTLQLFTGTELPVQVESCALLETLFELPEVHSIIRPALPHIVETLFAILFKYSIDSVSTLLESIIINFEDCIADFATVFVSKITTYFKENEHRFIAENAPDFAGTRRAQETGTSLLASLQTLVEHVALSPQLLYAFAPDMRAVIEPVWRHEIAEMLPDAFALFTAYTFKLRCVPAPLASLYACIPAFSPDTWEWHAGDIYACIDNFASFGKEAFWHDADAVQHAIAAALKHANPGGTGGASAHFDEEDAVDAHELLCTLILHSEGRVAACVPSFVDAALCLLAAAGSSKLLRVTALNTVFCCTHCGPGVALGAVCASGMYGVFRDSLANYDTVCVRVSDKKVYALMLICVLQRLGECAVYSEVLRLVLGNAVGIFKGYRKAVMELNDARLAESDASSAESGGAESVSDDASEAEEGSGEDNDELSEFESEGDFASLCEETMHVKPIDEIDIMGRLNAVLGEVVVVGREGYGLLVGLVGEECLKELCEVVAGNVGVI